jgi:hypothetical protein
MQMLNYTRALDIIMTFIKSFNERCQELEVRIILTPQ